MSYKIISLKNVWRYALLFMICFLVCSPACAQKKSTSLKIKHFVTQNAYLHSSEINGFSQFFVENCQFFHKQLNQVIQEYNSEDDPDALFKELKSLKKRIKKTQQEGKNLLGKSKEKLEASLSIKKEISKEKLTPLLELIEQEYKCMKETFVEQAFEHWITIIQEAIDLAEFKSMHSNKFMSSYTNDMTRANRSVDQYNHRADRFNETLHNGMGKIADLAIDFEEFKRPEFEKEFEDKLKKVGK